MLIWNLVSFIVESPPLCISIAGAKALNNEHITPSLDH